MIELAQDEAMARQSEKVEPEHILLALLKEIEGVAAQVLWMYNFHYENAVQGLNEVVRKKRYAFLERPIVWYGMYFIISSIVFILAFAALKFFFGVTSGWIYYTGVLVAFAIASVIIKRINRLSPVHPKRPYS